MKSKYFGRLQSLYKEALEELEKLCPSGKEIVLWEAPEDDIEDAYETYDELSELPTFVYVSKHYIYVPHAIVRVYRDEKDKLCIVGVDNGSETSYDEYELGVGELGMSELIMLVDFIIENK